jgi:diguanylate cyclase (GGDEF)-like protein
MGLRASKKIYILDPITLAFQDADMEQEYLRLEPERILPYIRPGLVIIILVVGLFGLLDSLIFPEIQTTAWQIRLYLALSIIAVLALTYTTYVSKFLQLALFVLMLLFGFSNIALILATPDAEPYLIGLILIMMWGYFAGLRFIHAFLASAIVTLTYVLFIVMSETHAEVNYYIHMPLLFAAFLISGFAGYSSERQRRLLFAQAQSMGEAHELHEQMALHDPLTNLPNRNLLSERMEQALARAKRRDNQFSVMFIDLDDFKTVNDNYGHVIGDQVLVAIADRLKKHVRTEDTVARIGGDEFVVLSDHIEDEHDVRIAAARILTEIAEPIVLRLRESDSVTINITGSLGISICPRDGISLEQLVERADDAMYQVKKTGKGTFEFFSSAAIA